MTRKDTILIAVVINAGLLAILFATAIIYDTDKITDKVLEQSELNVPLVEATKFNESAATLIATGPVIDEVDNVLKYYTHPSPQPLLLDPQVESYNHESLAIQLNASDEEDSQDIPVGLQPENFVEVVVKKGDVLEKIAKSNGTTVSAIKKINQLQSERLSIGQTLKIPVVKKSKQLVASTSTTAPPAKKINDQKDNLAQEPVYYVVKSGDNPWKIARQFNVKFEDILRLNQLDEERAKNLKIGDRIRVK